MMKKKHIEWGLLAPVAFGALAILCIVIYLFSSSIPALQVVLGMGSMVLILLAGVGMIIPMILVTLDIVQSKEMDGAHKIIWLGATWLLLGYFAAAGYYFLEVRKRPE